MGGGDPTFSRREWNGMEKIVLEYSSLFLFGSLMENEKFILLFENLSEREWNG